MHHVHCIVSASIVLFVRAHLIAAAALFLVDLVLASLGPISFTALDWYPSSLPLVALAGRLKELA